MVKSTVSGFSEMLSMPQLTRKRANSGESLGPWSQMPTLRPQAWARRTTYSASCVTARLRSTNRWTTISESRWSPAVNRSTN
jgi:hypothetical protein